MKEFKGVPFYAIAEDVFTVNSEAITSVYGDYTTQEQDEELATLFSAAPELLSALQELLIDIRIAQGNMRDAAKKDKRWDGCAEAFQSRVDAADIAIKKALGESQ